MDIMAVFMDFQRSGGDRQRNSCQCLKIFSTYPDIYQNRQDIFFSQIVSDVFEFILIDCLFRFFQI